MSKPLRLVEAARELGRSPATLRRWIGEGAPCASPGGPGRGRGALVDVAALRRWRALGGAPAVQHEEWLALVAEALLAYHREHEHRVIGLRDAAAAAYLHDLFCFIERRVGVELKLAELDLLEAIAKQG